MKSLIFISAVFIACSCISCKQEKNDKSFKIFNEGVALNLKSIQEQETGNFDKAAFLNQQSIEKFKETLKVNSTHSGVRSALGHSLYIAKQFDEAIRWFEQSNSLNGEAPQNYREMGLCKINLGDIPEGKQDLDKSFSMDTTREIRKLTIQDLNQIGEVAFKYGDGYIQQGEIDKGKDYKTFSIGVLILAFHYDTSRKDLALKISDFLDKLGDKETAAKYRAFMRD